MCTESTWAAPGYLRGAGGVARLGQRKLLLTMRLELPAMPGVIESFVSDPGVSFLLPDSLKPWQANLLSCEKGEILDLPSS